MALGRARELPPGTRVISFFATLRWLVSGRAISRMDLRDCIPAFTVGLFHTGQINRMVCFTTLPEATMIFILWNQACLLVSEVTALLLWFKYRNNFFFVFLDCT
jgi:hypothetical protein